MSVNPIPEGCEGMIPHLVVDGCMAAMAFYEKAFGAETMMCMPGPDGSKVMHAELRVGKSIFFMCDDFPEMCGGKPRHPKALGTSPVTLHQYVVDTDAAMKRAEDAGATVTMPATDMFWGDRYGTVVDPWGHFWSFATHVKDLTPEEIGQAAEAAFSGPGCGG